ncbi:MAG: chorismate mutase [Alphaproteobacteria bacterium]|nr:chorismate mutase [Alphaproteobacteria bacterium]MCB1551644.1 chorismate mutase [Alphaproteobacteria bacterium]MCB9984761.1 chorismate mutase [Micavibrio sp.]HRK98495.1 chorismate mutase [Alphaproteobacteria bacterium]
MYQSLPLDQIRQKIDGLDNQIHDLLLERADLIMAISEEKKKAGIQIVQPAREARMIRRLMTRHRGPLPEETIVRIWRELVSSVSLLQTGLSVAVYVPSEVPEYWDMARDYFGSVLPMQRASSTSETLDLVRSGNVTFAVIPFPDKGLSDPCWNGLIQDIEHEKGLAVIQRLPYGQKENYNYDRHPALVVAQSKFGESGDDCSLCYLVNEQARTKEEIISILKESGVTEFDLYGDGVLIIISIPEYFEGTSKKIVDLRDKMFSIGIRIGLLGGYPSPLSYKEYRK